MRMHQLAQDDLSNRLAGPGVLLRIGPFVARLGTRLTELHQPIQTLYHHYELAEEGGIVDFEVRVDPHIALRRPRTRMAKFLIDREPAFAQFDRRLALPMMEWALNWCLFTRPQQFFILHSAVVEKNGRALLLPGQPGSGKSTLCAALMLRGWRLLSDEVAMMYPGTRDIHAAPLPVGLKDASIGVIQGFDPSATLGPATPGTRKGTVAHVQPPLSSIERVNETARAAWVVFPAWSPDASPSLEQASKAESLLRLADDAFNFSILGEPAFETLADLIDTCGCYDLSYSDLDDAIELLDDLADRGEPVASVASDEQTGVTP